METPRTVELSPFKLMERYGALLQRISEAQFYFLILLLFAIPTTAVAIYCNLAIQWSFLTITSDTAAYQSAIVNTLAGAPFRDTAFDGPNMLGGHTCFSLLLVAPIYAIFPEVDTLFTLQVIGICAGVIPLYLYANSRGLSPAYSFLVSILFIVNPLVVHMIFAPFHPEVWAGTACAALLYFYQKNGQIGFWASAAFAVSCGEFDAPTLIAIGLFIYVSQDELPWRKTYAKNLLIAGFAWLFFAEVLFTPLFHDPAQRSPITVHYENWNVHSVYQLPMAILSDPGKMFSMLFSPYRWGLVTFLVGFPIFFILASPRTALIMAPFPLFFLMIDREFYLYFHSYYFQFALLAGVVAYIRFLVKWQATRIPMITLVLAFLVNIFFTFQSSQYYSILFFNKDNVDFVDQLHRAFDTIPRNACVYAPHRFSAYLSARPDMVMGDLQDPNYPNYNFYNYVDDRYATTHLHSSQIQYIVCYLMADQCGITAVQYNPDHLAKRAECIRGLLKSGVWRIYWKADNETAIILVRN